MMIYFSSSLFNTWLKQREERRKGNFCVIKTTKAGYKLCSL